MTRGVDLAATPAGRRVLFTALYFAEGAPIGFLWVALGGLLAQEGVPVEDFAPLVGALALPWAFKWLWSPLIDRLQTRRWTLRAWIVALQLAMAATLVPLLFASSPAAFLGLAPFLVLHALCAASQDAAIDALMLRVTPEDEQGRITAWMQAGYRCGIALLGGGALSLAARFGTDVAVGALIALVGGAVALAPLYRAPLPDAAGSAREPVRVGPLIAAALRRRATWIGLAFAATAGAGFEAVGTLASSLLTTLACGDTGPAEEFFLVPALVAIVGGGFAGGFAADRIGKRRAAAAAGLALGAAVLGLSARLAGGVGLDELQLWLGVVWIGIGAFTAASYALFLELTDPRLGATQFSAYMGATNLCEAWAVAAAGPLIGALGHPRAFAALAGVGLLALALLPFAHPPRRR